MQSDEEKGWLVLDAFYGELNRDPEFNKQFDALMNQLQTLVADRASDSILGTLYNDANIVQTIQGFCRRWRLPREGSEDLRWVFRHQRGSLRRGPRAVYLPTFGTPITGQTVLDDGTKVTMTDHRPLINIGASFEYDPLTKSRQWFEERLAERLEECRSQALKQAAILEEEARKAGFTVPRTHLLSPEHLRRLGRRLYLRAVKKASWENIAREEDNRATADAIRKVTTQWAGLLGILLPSASSVPRRQRIREMEGLSLRRAQQRSRSLR